ncbi:hypothetical protein [Pseudoalteromonas sp. H103]|uniref:hypothetical protein n=1 Tax=Pseudoalteromonas sp. H103 TaxID=1761893 RepID=UPI000731FC49|nr:hypothetical protein [Pseudoalteromonas sp. H103]KTF17393.1 hypothetical protein ATS74_01415 [Pseudoalteromonas sp. H103]
MRSRLMAILCVLISTIILSGCETNNAQQQSVVSSPAPVVDTTTTTKNKSTLPSPKARPKSEPTYPPAEQVIAWHANQCGGFKVAPVKQAYLGETELKHFFKYMCLNVNTDPNAVMSKLLKLDLAYFWPDDIKQYLWLQKQQVTMQINAKKEQQALNDKMQETLSSLATIEQQLLLREDTKEQ